MNTQLVRGYNIGERIERITEDMAKVGHECASSHRFEINAATPNKEITRTNFIAWQNGRFRDSKTGPQIDRLESVGPFQISQKYPVRCKIACVFCINYNDILNIYEFCYQLER